MSITLITGPATEPVTLAEAKLHLRVDVSDDDALITSLIVAMRTACENEIKRSLITQTWEKVMDFFPDAIQLPMPPIQSVTSITYIDVNGALQTLPTNQYVLDKDSEPGYVVRAINVNWPVTGDYINAVRVRYVAGYVAAANVPETIKLWMKIRLANAYDNREEFVLGRTMQEFPYVECLLDRYRVVQFL